MRDNGRDGIENRQILAEPSRLGIRPMSRGAVVRDNGTVWAPIRVGRTVMWDDEPVARGAEARPPGWDDFREARQRFLDRLEKETQLLLLERLWEMPAAGARLRGGATGTD